METVMSVDDVLAILTQIVATQQRIYNRLELAREERPDAVGESELDREFLVLLRANLELAEYLAKKK